MAIYVTSDAHGHLRALDKALELAAPGADDTIYVLGDMIDRGPDPLGVVKLVRGLSNAQVLMGNHERMMLDAYLRRDAGMGRDDFNLWYLNGGWVTDEQLDVVDQQDYADLIDWASELPIFKVIEAAGRTFILVHAGFDPVQGGEFLKEKGFVMKPDEGAAAVSPGLLEDMLAAQGSEDLLWIRGGFWDTPTGLVGADGSGPIVIAGHTPSVNIGHFLGSCPASSNGLDKETGCGTIVQVGACEATGGVPDRIDIDCSAAAGAEFGAVGVLRLDDFAQWVVPVEEGE